MNAGKHLDFLQKRVYWYMYMDSQDAGSRFKHGLSTRFIVPRIYQVPFVQGCTSRYKDVWARAFVANENEFLPDLNN